MRHRTTHSIPFSVVTRAAATLLLCLCATGTAYGEVRHTFLELTPGTGEGIYQLLRRAGLEANHDGLAAFRELNTDALGEDAAIYPDKAYRMPVYVVREDMAYDDVLAEMGFAPHGHKLDTYNRRYNEDYPPGDGDPLVLHIPQENTGFYGTGYLIPQIAETEAELVETGRFPGPYPGVKKQIKAAATDNRLAGYFFVLDPGHGGNDPGTNPHVMRGDGRQEHAYEAPLVYDTSMRLMKHLLLHGAEVFLTHYAPGFGIRNVKDPTEYRTQKYNLSSTDLRRDTHKNSVNERKKMAQTIRSRGYHKGRKIVFISVHADYVANENVDLPITIFYHRLPGLDKGRSRAFARNLAAAVTGSAKNVRSQGLGVLYKNSADLEVLVELVNLNNKNGAWRLRDYQYREKLAKRLGDGLVKVLGK